jgi:hypothetical protein
MIIFKVHNGFMLRLDGPVDRMASLDDTMVFNKFSDMCTWLSIHFDEQEEYAHAKDHGTQDHG